jgi:peroxiredoxin (alkyl hydroperoxide reductase subunit C)
VVVACSTDSAECHHGWLRLSKAEGGIQGVTYPMIADTNKTIASNFDVLDGEYDYDDEGELVGTSELICNRGLFLIDKEGVVQHQVVNNKPLGRSVDEALRMVDALRHFEAEGEVCPANWNSGSDAMKASFDGVADYLAAH